VRVGPRTAFGANVIAIAARLPSGADKIAALQELARAAIAFRTPHRDYKKERKRLALRLKLIDKLAADLRLELGHPTVLNDADAPRRTLEALSEIRRQTASAFVAFDAQVRAHARGANPALDVFYGEILRIWVAAGGKLTSPSTSKLGGPLYNYVKEVMLATNGSAPTREGVRTIVRRWRPWIVRRHSVDERRARKPRRRTKGRGVLTSKRRR
jgi:hypothetical protein